MYDVSADELKVEEFFLGFLKVDDTSGSGLFEVLQKALIDLGLDIGDVRGQGYDNGSNMKGKNKGVQNRQVNPRAFYTPCGCHSLNLAISDMANSCPKAVTFFGVVQRLYTLFSSSTKRWGILLKYVKEMKENKKGLTVKGLAPTRWENRIESVKAIRYQTQEIMAALYHLTKEDLDSKIKSEARSLAKYELGNFQFLLSLVIWHKILFHVNIVSKSLQKEDMHVDVAITQLKGLINFFDGYRQNGFVEAMNEAKNLATEIGIEPSFLIRIKRHIIRKKFFDDDDESEDEDLTLSLEESF